MPSGKPVGTLFAEISLDSTKAEVSLARLHDSLLKGTIKVEDAYKSLGIKSDQMYENQRRTAVAALDFIKNKTLSSTEEIARAQKAVSDRIKQINEEQRGHQTGIIDGLKKNWIAASAAVLAAWALVNKAVAYMDEGAKALQIESSFKIMADSARVNSENMIASMKAATRETIDDSALMQKAVKLMTLGYDPAQIERFSKVVITASQIAGTSAAEAYDQLADAIANRMPKALIRMGGVTREQMKIVTEAIAQGADSTALFELAMANLELKQKMLQGTQDEATIALQRFHAQVSETMETIGKGLIRSLQFLYGLLQGVAAGALTAAGGIAKLAQWLKELASWSLRKLGFTEWADEIKGAAHEAGYEAERLFKEASKMAEAAGANISGTAEVGKKATQQEIDSAKATVDTLMAKLKTIAGSEKAAKAAQAEADAYKRLQESFSSWSASIADSNPLLTEQEKGMAKLNAEVEKYIAGGIPMAEVYKQVAIANTNKALREEIDLMMEASKRADQAYAEQRALGAKQYDELMAKEANITASYKSLQESLDPLATAANKAAEAQQTLNDAVDYGITSAEEAAMVWQQYQDATDLKKANEAVAAANELATMYEQYAAYFSGIGSMQDEFTAVAIEAINKRRDAEIAALNLMKLTEEQKAKATIAINAKAAQDSGKVMQDAFVNRADKVATGLGEVSSAFQAISNSCEQGSAAAKSWAVAAQAFEVAQRVVAVVSAVAAIANQGLGDPYTAFGRIATMVATMGALLASIGETLSMTGGGGSAEEPKAFVPTTILGGTSGQESESIANALQALTDVDASSYTELVGIHTSMKDLNQNLTGIVRNMLQSNYAELTGLVHTLWSVGFPAPIAGMAVQGGRAGERGANTSGTWIAGGEWGVISAGMNKADQAMWQLVFKSLSDTMIESAERFGIDAQRVLDYTFSELDINISGMTPDKVNAAINAAVSAAADKAAIDLFFNEIGQYQKLGEGLYETLIRLNTETVVVVESLRMVGTEFNGVGLEAVKLSQYLVDAAGDLDTLQGQFKAFFEKFMTAPEQQAYIAGSLKDQLAAASMIIPVTRRGFEYLVQSIDVSTQAGATAYATLLRLVPLADQYYSAMEDATKNTLATAEDALRASFDAAKADITNQYNEQLTALNNQLTVAKNIVSDLTGIVNKLKSAKESMRLEDEAYLKGMQQWSMAKLTQMVATARTTGELPSAESLDLITKYLTSQDNTRFYSTMVDYQRDYWKTYNALGELQNIAGDQLTDAEKTIAAIEDEIKLLGDWKETQLTALDNQLNALLGIDTNVLSLSAAIEQYLSAKSATGTAGGGTGGAGGTTFTGPIADLYNDIFGRAVDAAGYAFYSAQLAGGRSITDIRNDLVYAQQRGAFAGGGYHAGGWRTVGERGPELEFTGPSTILNKQQANALIDMSEVKKELRSLRGDIQALKVENTKSRKLLDDADRRQREWDETGLLTRTA